jgi:hypothetical protein
VRLVSTCAITIKRPRESSRHVGRGRVLRLALYAKLYAVCDNRRRQTHVTAIDLRWGDRPLGSAIVSIFWPDESSQVAGFEPRSRSVPCNQITLSSLVLL